MEIACVFQRHLEHWTQHFRVVCPHDDPSRSRLIGVEIDEEPDVASDFGAGLATDFAAGALAGDAFVEAACPAWMIGDFDVTAFFLTVVCEGR